MKTFARLAVLCALYVAAGKLGLSLAFVHASTSAVWPATGIALAGFLLYGGRVWPAILLGAFLVNVTTSGSVVTSIAIAIGNTLEGLLGAWLVARFARGARFVERAQDFIKFALLAGLLATMVSASIGATMLVLTGQAPPAAFDDIWLTWWLGDAVGALVVTPVVVLWVMEPRVLLTTRRWLEAAMLLLTVIVVASVVFGGAWLGVPPRYPITFVVLPPLVWAAFRFGPRGVATAILAVLGIAVWGTLRGLGPFALPTPHESLLVLQAFMGTIAITAYTVVAVVAERQRAEEDAVAATRAKDEFLAVLSHELRTPLNAVVGWTAMLRSGGLDAATTEKALTTIERNARHQAQLIEDLLDVSRIVLGQVRLALAGPVARLEVRDTGKGIAAVFLPHLFERFRQADGSSRRAYGGLGIGLAIVRHLVELHGGSVRAESDGEGLGATFIVELPAARG